MLIVGLPDGLDVDELGDGFEALGYERPDEDDGVWNGGEELVAQIAGATAQPDARSSSTSPSTPTAHLLLASDNGPYLPQAVARLDDDLDDERPAPTSPRRSGEPLSAAVYTGDYACKALAMAQADDDDQSTADQLVAAAGDGRPADGVRDGGRSQTGTCAVGDGLRERRPGTPQRRQPRRSWPPDRRPARAATSPSGSRSGRSTADGRVVTMELKPVEGSPVLSDLSTGPVLFATC